jgi:hypothetical protein
VYIYYTLLMASSSSSSSPCPFNKSLPRLSLILPDDLGIELDNEVLCKAPRFEGLEEPEAEPYLLDDDEDEVFKEEENVEEENVDEEENVEEEENVLNVEENVEEDVFKKEEKEDKVLKEEKTKYHTLEYLLEPKSVSTTNDKIEPLTPKLKKTKSFLSKCIIA